MSDTNTFTPALNGHAASPETERQRAVGAWQAGLRGELLTPVFGLLDLSGSVLQDARKHPDSPEDFVLSLERIAEAARELHALAERTLSAEQPVGAAVSAQVRHDLRSYLTRIIGYCELWCEDGSAPILREFEDDLRKIHQVAQELVGGIDDLLSFPETAGRARRDPGHATSLPRAASLFPGAAEEGRKAAVTGKLLIADDHEINRDLLRRRLEREGHTVATAADGRQALELIRTQPFDLVLLDLLMPGLSGWQVLEQLKADPYRRDLPVIMISALNEIHSVVQCIEMGADDYLTRPVNPVLLRARITACLEKKRLRDREVSHLKKIERAERRAQELLHAVFPEPIARRLRPTRRPPPRRHERVAVLFADVVNFTPYCDQHAPEEVVQHLGRLVALWEHSAEAHGVQKIKTIGDAFMGAAGLLDKPANPVLNCVRCGLDMIAAVKRLPAQWDLRVGIHFGPVIAGVIGSRQYLYDLWGDTVNTAARLESHGVAGGVTLSMQAWQQIASLARGSERVMDVKGKGLLPTMLFTEFVPDAGGSQP